MDSLPVLRRETCTPEELASFRLDGYAAFRDILTDEGRDGLTREIIEKEEIREFIQSAEREPDRQSKVHFVRPWNDRGDWSDRLIDAPLVTALLKATLGRDYHFCHSSFNVALRGAERVPFHQDHHHWFHSNPVNLAEREKGYIQILYYPNGFARGDRSLSVIPGSHRVSPTPDVTPERLLAGEFDEEAGRPLRQVDLDLPPGSMIYLNARMFHAVEPKPIDSPQPYRLFTIDIFKEVGPPHRFTQEIPPDWIDRAGPDRRKLYLRDAWSPTCWDIPLAG